MLHKRRLFAPNRGSGSSAGVADVLGKLVAAVVLEVALLPLGFACEGCFA